MAKCVNKSHPDFLELVEKSGVNSDILAAKIGVWMEKNDSDEFPSLEQLDLVIRKIKEGVDFVFEQNPELANVVYKTLGFKDFVQGKQFQKLTAEEKAKTIEQVTKEHRSIVALKDLSAKLAYRIGGKVELVNRTDVDWKGYNQGITSVLNEAYMTPDTPFHEILAHPIIRAIKKKNDKKAYYEIESQTDKYVIVKNQQGGDKVFNTLQEANDFIVKENTTTLYQSLIKELETGRGKEVFEQVKRDYVTKEKPKSKNYNLIDSKNNSEIEIIQNFGNYWFKEYNETLNRGNQFNTNEELESLIKKEQNKHILNKYTLEEQQEEAIVTLLGMMAADKLDAKKDATLISKLKELWKQISDFVKSLLKQDGIIIDELPITTTLNDLAEIMAYGNNKIILPGYKIEYSTPLGNKYDTLEEVNQEIRGLADANVEVNLNGVKINKKRSTFRDLILNKKWSKHDGTGKTLIVANQIYKGNNGYFAFDGEDYIHVDYNTDKQTKIPFEEFISIISKVKQFDIDSDKDYLDRIVKLDIDDFIEKNKEYEQSKEIIEQWKKENNIQYDPEEVYSRGQGFYSSIGAYSNLELDLLLKNLIQHIEDNKKAGGEFTISAFTKPIDKRLKHIEGTGDRIRFVIYPKSEHIKWAAPTDVYSGSVWDAHEKVSKDKKSELLGVSFTKAPALSNINEVSPNLADIIDNLSHVHNELGIELTTDNFRIEYDDNIDYSTKKLIDNINKILDDKYGKLDKPEIKVLESKKITKFKVKGEPNIFNTREEAQALANKLSQIDYMSTYVVIPIQVDETIGKQPTQTKENTTSIESVIDKLNIQDNESKNKYERDLKNYELASKGILPEYYSKYTDFDGLLPEKIAIFAHKNQATIWQDIKYDDVLKPFIKEASQNQHGVKFWILKDSFTKDALESYKKPKEFIENTKEYTQQALINLKVVVLKKVARKYPRSLITSKVVPINPNMVNNSEIQYSKVGSKQDIEGFKNWISNNQQQKNTLYQQREDAIPLKGNERLYKHYNLLNDEGQIKQVLDNKSVKSWLNTLNQSPHYSFKLRNTMGGSKILIFPKSGMFQYDEEVFGEPIDYINENKKEVDAQIKRLQNKFASMGINLPVMADINISESARVQLVDSKPQIIFNPLKLRSDSIFHEFGHILIDLIEDQDFVKQGIEQLKGTKLWNQIAEIYWDKDDEQLGKEVLTTAIGLQARDIFYENKNKSEWRFWFNRLLDRIIGFIQKLTGKSPIENKEYSTATVIRLAKELTSDQFTFKLNNALRINENQQRNATEQKFLSDIQQFLLAKKNEINDTLRRYKGIPVTTSFGKRLHEAYDELEFINESNKDNLVITLTALTDTLKYDLDNLTALEKRAKELTEEFLDKHLTLADVSKEKFSYFTSSMRNLQLFLQNYLLIQKIGGLRPEDIENLNDEDSKKLKEISDYLVDSQKEMLPRVAELQSTFRRLMPLNTEFILQFTTNPQIKDKIREFVRDEMDVDMDESKLQLYLDAMLDSNNVLGANLAKLERVYEGRAELEARELQKQYWDVRHKVNGKSIDIAKELTDESGRLHRKYDYDKFHLQKDAYLGKFKPYTQKWFEGRNKFYMENTRFIEEVRNAPDVQKAVDDYFLNKKEKLGEIEYAEWFEKQYDNEHNQWRIGTELREPVDEYLNPEYTRIQNNPELFDLYNTIDELLKKCTESYANTPQERGYLPSILNKSSKHKYADHEETLEVVDAEGNVLHELPFKYIGFFAAKKEIIVRPRRENSADVYAETEARYSETLEEYNKDVIENLVKRGIIKADEFTTVEEIKKHNKEIRTENRKRHGEAINRDIDTVIPIFIKSAMTYKYKKEIEDSLLLGLAKMRHDEVKASLRTNSPKFKQTRDFEGKRIESTRSGVTSNAYRHADAWMRMIFYEKFIDPRSGDKVIGKIRDYASVLGMGFNFFAGVKNVSYGLFMNISEIEGARYYNPTDFAAANKMYFGSVTSYAADTMRKDGSTSSLTNGLIRLFDIIESYDEIMELQDPALSKEFAYKLFNDAAFFMQYSGEHMMQNITLLSMLHGYRLIDGKPMSFAEFQDSKITSLDYKDLDDLEVAKAKINANDEKRKELKKEFESYTRIVDIYEMEDGYAKIKEEYKDKFSDDEFVLFKEKIRGVNHKLHGIYNKADKGTVENTMLGQLAMQFRRWMRPGWNKRFGTRGGIFTNEEFWNERRDETDTGTYEALWKFVTTPWRKNSVTNWSSDEQRTAYAAAQAILNDYLRLITNTRVYWNTLTEEQKRKAIGAIMELAQLGIVLALYLLMMGFRDKDDKLKHYKFYNFILYQLSASTTELATYLPIYGWFNETGKILQNPTAVYGLGINVWRFTKASLMYPFIAEEDRYFKGGVNHDKLKVGVYAGRFIPGVNMYLRWSNLDNQTKAYRTQ